MEEVQNILKHKYFVVYAYRNVYKVFLLLLFQKCIVSEFKQLKEWIKD